ncbi:MAG: protein-arginine deiminase family protein [Myxococcota bacterium]
MGQSEGSDGLLNSYDDFGNNELFGSLSNQTSCHQLKPTVRINRVGADTFRASGYPSGGDYTWSVRGTTGRAQIEANGDRSTLRQWVRGVEVVVCYVYEHQRVYASLVVDTPTLHMHLDATRDGGIDRDPANYGDWRWGAASDEHPQPGGVLLVPHIPAANADPVRERTILRFLWSDYPGRQGWEGTLHANHPNRIRVYASRRANANALDLTNGLDLTQHVDEGRLDLWMQAADYGGAQEASWRVQLTFRFTSAEGNRVTETAELRIAPWIMSSDLDPTRYLYVMAFRTQNPSPVKNGGQTTTNASLRTSLGNAVGQIPIEAFAVMSNRRYVRDTMRFGTINQPGNRSYPVALRGNQEPLDLPVVLDAANRGIEIVVKGNQDNGSNYNTGGNLVVSPPSEDYPWGRIITGGHDADTNVLCQAWRNFFAHQKVQRPILVDTRWLSVGHSDECLAFVPVPNAQGQHRMLIASPRRAYQILRGIDLAAVAQIRQAQTNGNGAVAADQPAIPFATLRGQSPSDFSSNERTARQQQDTQARLLKMQQGSGRLLFNRFNHFGELKQKWIDQFLDQDPLIRRGHNATPNAGQIRDRLDALWTNQMLAPAGILDNDPYLWTQPPLDALRVRLGNAVNGLQLGVDCVPSVLFQNLAIQVTLDKIRALVQQAIGIEDEHVIEVPVLFHFEVNGAHGLTTDMVNFVLLAQENRCIVPEPHGPLMNGTDLFKRAFQRDLTDLGLNVTFIDEWHEYHLDDGEIHCGTNQCPVTDRSKQWWLYPPPN